MGLVATHEGIAEMRRSLSALNEARWLVRTFEFAPLVEMCGKRRGLVKSIRMSRKPRARRFLRPARSNEKGQSGVFICVPEFATCLNYHLLSLVLAGRDQNDRFTRRSHQVGVGP